MKSAICVHWYCVDTLYLCTLGDDQTTEYSHDNTGIYHAMCVGCDSSGWQYVLPFTYCKNLVWQLYYSTYALCQKCAVFGRINNTSTMASGNVVVWLKWLRTIPKVVTYLVIALALPSASVYVQHNYPLQLWYPISFLLPEHQSYIFQVAHTFSTDFRLYGCSCSPSSECQKMPFCSSHTIKAMIIDREKSASFIITVASH